MKIHDTGCPICGEDNADQLAHVMADHSWHERWRLYWQTRTPLPDLLLARKFGVNIARPSGGAR